MPSDTLTFSEHDQRLLVWGAVDDQGQVQAYRDEEAADRAANAAGPVVVVLETSGGPRRTTCSRLVYHHTDLGWVFAATGHPLAIVTLPTDTS